MMGGRPNFNHPFAKAVIDRVKETLVVYQQRMKGIVVSVATDGKSAVVRRHDEPANIQKKPYVNTVSGLAVGDEVVCMVDRGGGVITGAVGGKAPAGGGGGGGTTHLEPELTDTALASAYPYGVSAMNGTTGNGWPVTGTVLTLRVSASRVKQVVYSSSSSAEHHRYNDPQTGWSAWVAK